MERQLCQRGVRRRLGGRDRCIGARSSDRPRQQHLLSSGPSFESEYNVWILFRYSWFTRGRRSWHERLCSQLYTPPPSHPRHRFLTALYTAHLVTYIDCTPALLFSSFVVLINEKKERTARTCASHGIKNKTAKHINLQRTDPGRLREIGLMTARCSLLQVVFFHLLVARFRAGTSALEETSHQS